MRALTHPIKITTTVLCLVMVIVAAARAQIPHYTNSQMGVFGSGENFGYGSPVMTLNSTNDSMSARFTVYENVTVDRAWMRLINVDAGTDIRIGIMADDGTGKPSGTYLSSATLSFGAAFSAITNATFSGVALTSGNVYHVVTRVPTLPSGQDFRIYGGANQGIRPYDRAADTNMLVLTSNEGGAWANTSFEPYFVLGDGANLVAGPGQPVHDLANSTFLTRGGTGSGYGERFVISDKEIAPGQSVAFSQIQLIANAVGGPTDELIVRVRETNGTILASGVLAAAAATGTVFQTIALDAQVELAQGAPYLVTTEFGGAGGTLTQYYYLYGWRASAGPGFGAAGWGGTNINYPIISASGNNWSSYSVYSVGIHNDLAFTFQGIVVPEPSTMLLLVMAGLLFPLRSERR